MLCALLPAIVWPGLSVNDPGGGLQFVSRIERLKLIRMIGSVLCEQTLRKAIIATRWHTCSNNNALSVCCPATIGQVLLIRDVCLGCFSCLDSLSNLITYAHRQTAIRGTTQFADIVVQFPCRLARFQCGTASVICLHWWVLVDRELHCRHHFATPRSL